MERRCCRWLKVCACGAVHTWNVLTTDGAVYRIYPPNLSKGCLSERFFRSISDHKSPASATRWTIVRNVKLFGCTSPPSTSSHVHGADTGAPDFARTV